MNRSATRIVTTALAGAALFEVALFASKETPAVYGHAPWLDDPYDAAVSFALFCIPLIVAPSALRVLASMQLPDRAAPERLADLLRACTVALVAVAVTLAACWAAVAAGANRAAWNSMTAVQVAVLALFTAGTIACAADIRTGAIRLQRGVGGLVDRAPLPSDGGVGRPALRDAPDWLSDMIAAGRLLARVGGSAGRPVTRVLDWTDERVVPAVRRHPIGAAAVIASAVGLLVAVSQSVNEGYRPVVAIVLFCVATAGVFAFVATAGRYLRVIRTDRPASARMPVIRATVMAAAAVPVALAFRSALWSLVGARQHGTGIGALFALLAAASLLTFGVSLAGERVTRARRRTDEPPAP